MDKLAERRCKPCEGGVPALDLAAATKLKEQLARRWKWARDGKAIEAAFEFDNYWQTTAFVNAVAWIAHTADHHPDISFGYNKCSVSYWTHAVDGLTENDFICAAKIDALLD
ncbi:4a-hydroxytetrahydrobiopterin dehydratase [Solimonas flava]|uniref:4a-hydroxytetrahydrobiopterin dehydratase n=1 Tax=Solimonas flava TaxID=415849 RepID=UPI0004076CDA|nr:4a-hydroxytetrahydrobiopterin dehydratase [Solimonas flava]